MPLKKYYYILAVLMLLSSHGTILADSGTQTSFWRYQCIDTVKYSRDTARDWTGKDVQLNALIAAQIALVKNSGANCVAIDTPYDPEFIAFLSKWVMAARSQNLTVWFRGNLSGWEGWFNYPKLGSIGQHNAGIYRFIIQNPWIFADTDIFTPVPEPENGILGNPFANSQSAQNLRDFLASSYVNCQKAFAAIHKTVGCGFFPVSLNVAADIFDTQTIQRTGNLAVVDHYAKTEGQLAGDLQNLHDEFDSQVFLGEFGAPIPDIHGNLTENEQAGLIDRMLNKLYQEKSFILGVNYWVLTGGSTALINSDGTQRQVYQVLKDYYDPGKTEGVVYNSAGDRLANVKIAEDNGNNLTSTDAQGNFSLKLPANHKMTLTASLGNYQSVSYQISVGQGGAEQTTLIMNPTKPSIFYQLRKIYHKLTSIL